MPYSLSIPRDGGAAADLTIEPGQILFLLGANGTGKSSLMHSFYKAHHSKVRRITAHRQTWFESNAITLSPQQRQKTENQMGVTDMSPDSRWKDVYAASRASIAIYDLVDSENVRARSIAEAVDHDNFDLAKELRIKEAPIKIINELLRLSNIPITIAIHDNDQIVARKNRSDYFSIAELSDGERNAILIAASVLTVKPGVLLLIDEPERHLHRSIISPLLTLLFAKRSDCPFVVSTHEVMLPLDNPSARTLLIRGCTYKKSAVTAWDADVMDAESGIGDDLKRDILGARRKILFVEGTEKSLDKPLYSLVFPNTSIIPKGSCRYVEQAVSSIRDAEELHWLKAFGLVDNDRRPQAEIDRLRNIGVYATAGFSVESVYYHPDIQRRISERHANTTGDDVEKCLARASAAAIRAVAPHVQRFSERTAEKQVRERFLAEIPNSNHIAAAIPVSFSINVPEIVGSERARLQSAIDAGDLGTILSRYPVRESPALHEIARELGFQSRDQYEGAVRKLLMEDAGALAIVRSLHDTLAHDLEAKSINGGTSLADPPPIIVASVA